VMLLLRTVNRGNGSVYLELAKRDTSHISTDLPLLDEIKRSRLLSIPRNGNGSGTGTGNFHFGKVSTVGGEIGMAVCGGGGDEGYRHGDAKAFQAMLLADPYP
jgi:hypothetical protein